MYIWESVTNCQNYRFFDIFHKMKENLGHEHGFYPSREKIGTIFPAIPGKMTVFPVLLMLFHQSLPKIWLPTYTKIKLHQQ